MIDTGPIIRGLANINAALAAIKHDPDANERTRGQVEFARKHLKAMREHVHAELDRLEEEQTKKNS